MNIKKTIIKYLYIILLIFFFYNVNAQVRYTIKCDSILWHQSLDTAVSQAGIKEKGNNAGECEKYLNSVGLGKGNPYCMALQYWSFEAVCKKLNKPNPLFKTGHCVTEFNHFKKNGKRNDGISIGDFLFWANSQGYGHVGRVVAISAGGWLLLIEGNTSSGNVGSQDNGDGNFLRRRNWRTALGTKKFKGFGGAKLIKN